MSEIAIRPAASADAGPCGRICHDGFHAVATQHGFPPDFPSPEVAAGLLSWLIAHPGFHGVVAERDGRVLGSNFLDERDAVAGVGPITVDRTAQDKGVGRRLMEAVLDRADNRGFESVRLCQAAYHNRSLALYTSLGFDAREPLSTVQGAPLRRALPGTAVRAMRPEDIAACGRLGERILGHARSGELADAVAAGTAMLVERDGRITGYTSNVAFFGHTIGETTGDVAALIAAAPEFAGPGFLIPTRNAELLRWCLAQGLKIVQPMTLMSRGGWIKPRGAWMPSVLY